MALRPPGSTEGPIRVKVFNAVSALNEAMNYARAAAVDLKGPTRFRGQRKVRSALLGIAHRVSLEAARLNKELRALNGVNRTPPASS